MARILTCALAVAALMLMTTDDAQAQHDPWTISIEAEGGGYFPVRAFGKNATGTEEPTLIVLQPSAKAQAAPVAGVGIRLQLPNPSMSLRLQAFRTFGGEIEGRTPLCDVVIQGADLYTRYRCATDFSEEYTVSELIARMQFKTNATDSRLRPTVDLGIGVRRYEFGGVDEPCNVLLEEAEFICTNVDGLTADQTQPLLLFGLGLEYSTSRINPFVRLHLQVSPYGGDADGGTVTQQELLGSVGFSINVR